MENSKIIIGYIIYLPIVISLTIYISKMLFKNGKLFMIDIFKGKEDIAIATNKLFEIGFYLINIGFALYIMKIYGYNHNYDISNQTLMEILSKKIGGFTIYLGVMLFFNLFLFFRGRKKSRQVIRTTKVL
ncbi:hypothetical protein BTO05_06110 [Winogradskyella sp. PC-19]|uniref:hypothetical protein n=1 Tax=unclassified Winogradskyella TaxID=2615021 RepID=UPI000B3C1BE3|nr:MULTISPECIES: hypothetical protein [unclassified Winogradskyella]ARV09236.1 hypothetical protein BTO05_06110 [Winogradskyella sp. PC-19]RZN82448.1 MAG: hypothetical protein EVB12_02925 [Winogradskyella sp.]